jgi:hypothetical protein
MKGKFWRRLASCKPKPNLNTIKNLPFSAFPNHQPLHALPSFSWLCPSSALPPFTSIQFLICIVSFSISIPSILPIFFWFLLSLFLFSFLDSVPYSSISSLYLSLFLWSSYISQVFTLSLSNLSTLSTSPGLFISISLLPLKILSLIT